MVLEIRKLVVARGRFRLEVERLKVARRTVLLGRNGSGKSTLLKAVMGLIRTSSGEIIVEGRDISQLSAEDRPLGYVPQRVARLPMTPRQQLEFFSRLHGRDYADLADEMGLLPLLEKSRLSTGEYQMLAIATALLKNPKTLLLDEPCSSLDWPNKKLVLRLVMNLRIPVLYVTHDPFEALFLADEIAFLEEGRLRGVFQNMASGKVAELLEEYDLYKMFTT